MVYQRYAENKADKLSYTPSPPSLSCLRSSDLCRLPLLKSRFRFPEHRRMFPLGFCCHPAKMLSSFVFTILYFSRIKEKYLMLNIYHCEICSPEIHPCRLNTAFVFSCQHSHFTCIKHNGTTTTLWNFDNVSFRIFPLNVLLITLHTGTNLINFPSLFFP